MQRLILPFQRTILSAGYQNQNYLKRFGFSHYGVDMGSAEAGYQVKALGRGEIVACGQDGKTLTGPQSRLGQVIVVLYREVRCSDGKDRDLVCRMYHFDQILCKPGEQAEAGTVIGRYGNTGANTTGAHLHLEFDEDTAYPLHAFGISSGGRIIQRGTVNSTVNPVNVWFLGEGQTFTGSTTSDCYTPEDLRIRKLPEKEDYETLYRELDAKYRTLAEGLQSLASLIEQK